MNQALKTGDTVIDEFGNEWVLELYTPEEIKENICMAKEGKIHPFFLPECVGALHYPGHGGSYEWANGLTADKLKKLRLK